MPLARLRAALPAAALSLLLLTGCTATDDGVTPASDADTSASGSTMPITSTPSVDAAATSRAAHAAEGSRAAEASRSAGPTAPAAPADVEGDVVTVESISDGDTLRVTLGEVSTRVRLLNIDTPETRHPSKPVECMGPEATAALKSMISPGDTVVLRYDRRLYDRYDRLLAGVYADGVLVNAEMARLGYGEPAVFDGNDRFLPEVEAAWEQARANGVGRFSGECGTAAEPIPEAAPAPAPEAAPASGDAGPVSGADSVCPDSHPVKANDNSGIYHMPGQQHYGKTNARNCYASAAAAQADGYRAARR
ncbi:thermonuclease family protein [Micrococcus luteus]|uniref:thermonuclease family protein n=1 Tax=Micrococcus luteus TaxID=1270 RepID=UPI000D504C3B|nr:thermonuclease family protein [Micrococcus luteus]AWD24857.1 thermonuclease family protein [Micrococcus luteus]MCV7665431.1 thermonuclease family protein [Micrococcus luteus]NNM49405.1 thermonuclease family protein [Micrococcus luteus]